LETLGLKVLQFTVVIHSMDRTWIARQKLVAGVDTGEGTLTLAGG
jgi:hypothetical protein